MIRLVSFGAALLVTSVTLVSCSNEPGTTTSTTVAVVDNVTSPDSSGNAAIPASTTTSMALTTALITVTVGLDSGPERIENVPLGQEVELRITNPEDDDEFHVHGYDLGGDETAAGEEKVFAFTATEAGDFEVESHATGEVLVVIRVS